MLKLLQTEAIKLRKDKATIWALIGLAGATLMVTMMFAFGRADLLERHAWKASFFIGQTVTMLSLILGPMMLAVIGAQLLAVEYKSKTLKGLLPLPASLPGIFAAKAVLGTAALGAGLLFTALLTILVPTVLGIPPSAAMMGGLLRDMLVLWVAFLPLLFFAMLLGLASKNFVVPLAASAVVLVGGVLAMQGDKGQYFWTSIPMILLGGQHKLANLGPRLGTSLGYAAVFVLAGLLWAKLTKRPE